MFDCTNLFSPNSTSTLKACNTVSEGLSSAGNFVATNAGKLGSHMVSQYSNFQKFIASESSTEKTAQITQRLFTGAAAAKALALTFNATCKSAAALFKGKFLESLGYGIAAVGGAAVTYSLTSLTLDPVRYIEIQQINLKNLI